jgi:hypothetical protein
VNARGPCVIGRRCGLNEQGHRDAGQQRGHHRYRLELRRLAEGTKEKSSTMAYARRVFFGAPGSWSGFFVVFSTLLMQT